MWVTQPPAFEQPPATPVAVSAACAATQRRSQSVVLAHESAQGATIRSARTVARVSRLVIHRQTHGRLAHFGRHLLVVLRVMAAGVRPPTTRSGALRRWRSSGLIGQCRGQTFALSPKGSASRSAARLAGRFRATTFSCGARQARICQPSAGQRWVARSRASIPALHAPYAVRRGWHPAPCRRRSGGS